jgi:hypothetical protein
MPQDLMEIQVFATSFAGPELARTMAWGAGVDRRSDYERAIPTSMCNMPRHVLEPIIPKAAKANGAEIRLWHELLELNEVANGIDVMIRNRPKNEEYRIRAKYIVGADGGRSIVAHQMLIDFDGEGKIGDPRKCLVEGGFFQVCKAPLPCTWPSSIIPGARCFLSYGFASPPGMNGILSSLGHNFRGRRVGALDSTTNRSRNRRLLREILDQKGIAGPGYCFVAPISGLGRSTLRVRRTAKQAIAQRALMGALFAPRWACSHSCC